MAGLVKVASLCAAELEQTWGLLCSRIKLCEDKLGCSTLLPLGVNFSRHGMPLGRALFQLEGHLGQVPV